MCTKAAPITDRKAERPKNFGLYQKFDPSFLSAPGGRGSPKIMSGISLLREWLDKKLTLDYLT